MNRARVDWTWPVHPLLAAAYPVVFLFAANAADQVTLEPLWGPLFQAVATAGVLFAVLFRVLRDRWRAGLLTTLLVTLFYWYGHVWNVIGAWLGGQLPFVVLWAAIALVGVVVILRAGDWVGQIRKPARTELARVLAEESEKYLPRAVPMAVKLAGRYHGRYAYDLVTAAVLAAPAEVRRRLATSPDRDQRRLAFDADLSQDRLDLDALAGLAAQESDALIRHRAAQEAYERAVDGGHRPALRRLGTARSAGVRALGLTGLRQLGSEEDAVAALNDPAPLVRAIAREAARRSGIDVVEHYRSAEPSPGSVAGLAEVGSDREGPVLLALLDHPSGAIRAAAVRALGRLGTVPVELVLPLLRDPAPAVVREAAVFLSPFGRRLPAALPWELLGDGRPEVRRAGYRLLQARDLVTRFRAAVRLAVDTDARNADRGRLDALRLAHRPGAVRHGYETPEPAIAEMRALVETYRGALGPAGDRLAELLDRPR